jgi:hypothetical protein
MSQGMYEVINCREILKTLDFRDREKIKQYMAPCINCGEFRRKTELQRGQCSICNISPEIKNYRRKNSPNFFKIC